MSSHNDRKVNFKQIVSNGFVLGVSSLPLQNGQQAYLLFGNSKAELTPNMESLERSAILVLIFMLFVVAPIGAYYLNYIFTSPINRLMAGVEGMREGNREHLSGFDSKDELSVLAQAINSMSDSIVKRERELRESEERFRALADNTPNKLHIKDVDGRYILINRRSENLFGISNEEAVGKTTRELFPIEMSKAFDAHDKTVIESGRTIEAEEEFRLDDGIHTFLTVKFPIRDQDGSVIAVGASGFDITERKRAEAQLVQSSKLATLGEVTTGIAHELNQPLNIIRMATETLQELSEDGEVPDDVLSDKLGRIVGQVDRAAEIINHMRIFGRNDAGEVEDVDLKEALRGAIGLVKEQMRLSGIELITDIPETCRNALGRRLQVEQVIINLLINARDAINEHEDSEAGSKQIKAVIIDDASSEKVRLIIQDTGGGIPDTILNRIFEPFFTTKEVGQGTGLGLSISYGIISEMGGVIEASNVDGGARFIISMPAANETPA